MCYNRKAPWMTWSKSKNEDDNISAVFSTSMILLISMSDIKFLMKDVWLLLSIMWYE